MKKTTTQTIKKATMRIAALLAAIAAPSAFAASQTWSNAPQNALWAGSSNWIANASPGALNVTGNNVNNDIATFNSPLAGGIGGAGNPILIDDGTVANGRSRSVGGFRFSGDAGAYEFSTLSAPTFPSATLGGTGILYIHHNNNITMDASVTNAQRFLVPTVIRLPSSTDGRYFITNNATSSDATIYFSTLTNSSASSRQLILVLNGSNTGTNTIAALGENVSGALRVVKTGTGRWILSGANQWSQQTDGIPAGMLLEQGTLVVKDVAAFGGLSSGNISISNGVLQIDGVTLQSLGLTLRNGGTIRMNGSGALNSLIVANQAGNNSTLATTSASDVFTIGVLGSNSGGLADSTLNTAGPGTVTYAIANTYIGKHVFSAATNVIQIPGALGTGPNLHLSAGAVADITIQGPATYTLDTAALSANGTGTVIGSSAAAIIADAAGTFDIGSKPVALTFTPTSFSGDTTHPSLYVAQGTLALGGNTFTINNASGTPLGAGTYRLVQQAAGSITSGGSYSAIVTGSGLAPLGVATIQVSGGNIDLIVTIYTPKNLSWKGGNPDATWDLNTTANFDDAGLFSVFNNTDVLTFGALGSANPSVSLVGSLSPGGIVVDTSANDYSFTGAGIISGTTGLTKNNSGVLTLGTANSYQGGTTVNGGTVRIGVNNAIPSSGSGNVSVQSPGIIDLNNLNNSINGLSGTGVVDNQGGAASTITVGNNNATSTFSGLLTNTAGTLGLTKAGNGTLTLTGAQGYSGPTIINAGTLEVQNVNALGAGLSPVAVNAGALRTTTSLNLNSLTGADGTTFANTTGAGTTILTHTGTGNYTGIISDGVAGTIGIYVPSGTLQLNGANTYSGSTIVASGATLAFGVRNPGGSGTAGTGGITASNNVTISLPTSLSTSSQVPNNVTNVDANGTVYFSSVGQANSFNGQFIGGANATNVLSGPMSLGGNQSFASFPGTVVVSNGANVRFFTGTGIDGGGDNTTFILNGTMFNRDPRTTRVGALTGTGSIVGPSTGPATFNIGAKNLSTIFSGTISGNNNINKVGTGSLTLNGTNSTIVTNIVTLPDPFEPTNIVEYAFATNISRVTYIGSTVISNGTLKVVAPNNLTNSSSITLVGGTLDATDIGYFFYQTTLDYNNIEQNTNSVVVTDGIVRILDGRSLNGHGSLLGSVIASSNATMTVGSPIGTLAISGSLALDQAVVNMNLNRTNSPNNSDRITAASFSGSGSTLNVTDAGPALFTGTVCQLFSGPVSAFTVVNLPATNGATTYVWTNKIAINGTIELLSGASPVDPNPTNITSTVVGSNLQLAWPSSHIGWTLQAQTNALNVGLTGTWFDVAGSATTNQVFVPIVPGNPTVFYRLKL